MPRKRKSSRKAKTAKPRITRAEEARAFAEAIFAKCDPVQVACDLLGEKSESKGASVKLRMLETGLEYLYGRPPAMAGVAEPGMRIIWDLPAPARDSEED